MIDENKYNQYGYKRSISDIYGITIHNTNNYEMSARDVFNYLNNESKDNAGYHLVIDDKETIQIMPFDYAVYHTGKGNDFGNQYTIAIAICSNLNDELYEKSQIVAISLIKALMEEYNITKDRIYFHNDFNSATYCPATILDKYGTKSNFIELFFKGDL